jgi:hypothetical protein
VVLVASTFAACQVRPEQSVLDRFFAESRLRDKTALAKFSTIIYEPLDAGIVVDFTITEVAREGSSKNVTVDAKVKRPDGRVVPATMIVLMQQDPDVGWKITGLVER